MDLEKFLKRAVSKKEEGLTPIYSQLKKLWKEFNESSNVEPPDWAEAEGLEGLFPLNNDKIEEIYKLLPLSGREIASKSTEEMTLLITSLLTGIRLGYALKEVRDGERALKR